MALEPFDVLCAAAAQAEQAVCVVTSTTCGVPPGRYVLREFYCRELDCDCRRVLVQFFRSDHGLRPEVLASINFGWETPRFYRKWSRVPGMWREMAGATLEPLAEQGPRARSFLALFRSSAHQPAFVDAFRRHYALVKDLLARGELRPRWR
jgi:hypothetical protein